MPRTKCMQCDGTGSDSFSGEFCQSCHGQGYQISNKADTEKGYITLGLIGGIIVGFGAYVLTLDIGIAIGAGMITTVLVATVIGFIFKHLLAILIIGYLLYLLFG